MYWQSDFPPFSSPPSASEETTLLLLRIVEPVDDEGEGEGEGSQSLSFSLSLSAVSSISVPFRLFSEWQARNRDDGCSLYFSSEFSPLSTCFWSCTG